MKSKLMNAILKPLVASGMILYLAGSLMGCVTMSRTDWLAKKLGVPYSLVDRHSFGEGDVYFSTKMGTMDLTNVAGILSGDLKVKKTSKGYSVDGTFIPYSNRKEMEKACKLADIDDDKIVTNKEARDSLKGILKGE